MHRLLPLLAALAVLGGTITAHPVGTSAQPRRQAKPPQPPRIIQRDWRYVPAPQPAPRYYYEPAPGPQAPMQRVPMPAPLAQPPINR
jgi:hypothetical protein